MTMQHGFMQPIVERPTPECDAEKYADLDGWGAWIPGTECVSYDFARRLERERDEARAERDRYRIWWERDSQSLGTVIGQRDTARAVAEDNRARYVTAEAERDAALTQLDAALTRLQTAHGERDAAREALNGCIEHLEWSTKQGKAAFDRAIAVLEGKS